jgi:hypothetical protein
MISLRWWGRWNAGWWIGKHEILVKVPIAVYYILKVTKNEVTFSLIWFITGMSVYCLKSVKWSNEWITKTGSMVHGFSWEVDGFPVGEEISPFYAAGGFISLFTIACQWTPSWARWIQSTLSHPISQKFVLILIILRSLPRGLFPSDFRTKILTEQTGLVRKYNS